MYYKKTKIQETYPLLSDTMIELYENQGLIKYSKRTDKYDVDDIFQIRTMQFGLEKLLNTITLKEKKRLLKYLENKSKEQSKLKNKLTLLLTKKENGNLNKKEKLLNLTDSGSNRFHRIYGKKLNLDTVECDSCFSLVKGTISSLKTNNSNTIKELEEKHKKISEYILKQEEIKQENKENYIKNQIIKEENINIKYKKDKKKLLKLKKRLSNDKIKKKKYSLIKIEKKLSKLQSNLISGINYGGTIQKKINNLNQQLNIIDNSVKKKKQLPSNRIIIKNNLKKKYSIVKISKLEINKQKQLLNQINNKTKLTNKDKLAKKKIKSKIKELKLQRINKRLEYFIFNKFKEK